MAKAPSDPEIWRQASAIGSYHWAVDYVSMGHAGLKYFRGQQRENQRHHSSVPFSIHFCFGHGIELAIKAFLLDRGVEVQTLRSRPFGHDLVALMQKAKELGLPEIWKPTVVHTQAIELLNVHYADKWFEYIRIGGVTLPDIDQVALAADRLLDALAAVPLKVANQDERMLPRRGGWWKG